ncbi:2-succinyl-5-enolpyruvyl-6-hydroxy-3-cyclohexene-1-carboxylic-acid synthase [Gilvibacter sediminis]|uniref:2-succinyl-5-enolpyruvyl-6-hydroxy-3- cyclohexene-1-carboxylic-acid synthase n=1 Tax=Gilvibacter sediminis TaxID=379071 RepID=UPI00235062B1|nr:2-succinyl-5-enolpyruvyl-6-hydroxy-3-cyclohexene-1-carboxylic-acid synthase [Gilvibacter sediminis]MDC7999083.1 2-succinyl-5-enolpyruvyl-6-hydroxy-3-cyclohexene-1-carboxylic-acid synthase [Gilvibacter sediminis]
MAQNLEEKTYSSIPLAQLAVAACKAHGISRVIISPGSRNAPLTLGFTNDPYFACYSIVDERVAAFFGLGMSQFDGVPTVLICTSGSAVLNYFPAIAEAYYSRIPLVVLSADRPAHKIDIGDGQTIKQQGVFGDHVSFSAQCIEDCGADSVNHQYFQRALNTAIKQKRPVHLNLPFEEPLYQLVDGPSVHYMAETLVEEKAAFELPLDFLEDFDRAKRIMVIAGVMPPGAVETQALDKLLNDPRVLMLTETTSNLHHSKLVSGIDQLIAALDPEELAALKPDLLISFGGMVVSKKIKAFLRGHAPKWHWHIDPLEANDTYFALKGHLETTVTDFLERLPESKWKQEASYQKDWLQLRDAFRKNHHRYLAAIPFSDLKAYGVVFDALPAGITIQVANSAAIRYAQLFELPESVAVYCNRGTSGIDGSTSTALGHAVVCDDPVLFVTGDLSFFYDSNALWNNHTPANFRIILINNSGGGIFRILPGDKSKDNFTTYFETVHGLNASSLAEMYGWDYSSVTSFSDLHQHLEESFWQGDKPAILEVFTPREENDQLLLDYFKAVKQGL